MGDISDCISGWMWLVHDVGGFLPVDASVVVVPIEELDLLKRLLAGVITGQVRVHAEKQVERRRPWKGRDGSEKRRRQRVGCGMKKIKRKQKGKSFKELQSPFWSAVKMNHNHSLPPSCLISKEIIKTSFKPLKARQVCLEWLTSHLITSHFILQGVSKDCVSPVFWGPMTSSLGKRSHVFSLDQMSLCLLSSQGSCSHKKDKQSLCFNRVSCRIRTNM